MKSTSKKLIPGGTLTLFIVFLLVLSVNGPVFAQTMGTYTSYPPVMASSVKASALILLSNDWTGFTEGYQQPYNDSIDYYGYFDPKKSYKYTTAKKFFPYQVNASTTNHHAPAGYWSGNFLNWLTMSHGDFLRKALTGGRRGDDAVASTRLERANIATRPWTKEPLDYTGYLPENFTPFSGSVKFKSTGIKLQATKGNTALGQYDVQVEVCSSEVSLENNCTLYPAGNYKPQGLLQRYSDRIDFGLMTYSHGKVDAGGIIRRNIGDVSFEFSQTNGQENSGISGMIRYINNYTEKGWDPLGEMYFDALRFYKGLTTAGATSAFCPSGTNDDSYPFFGCASNKPWEDPITTWCQKNSIVILNDEYPSRDHESISGSPFSTFTSSDFPIDASAWTKAVGDAEGITGTDRFVGNILGGLQDNSCKATKFINDLSKVTGMCPSEGDANASYLLAGLAHYAMTEDIRPDMPGDQNVRTYTIAFRASDQEYFVPPAPMNPLWLAAKYGNFNDVNGNNLPDLQEEWDVVPLGGDGQPDGFFYAESGGGVEDALEKVFDLVIKGSASGTSVSVLATSGEGQGNLVQAYYRPRQTIGGKDIYWTGYLQSLWVDEKGFIREDTNANHSLDTSTDKVVRYFVDTDGVTKVMRFDVSSEHPYPDVLNDSPVIKGMDDVAVVWEAGSRLASRSADSRKIYTYLDLDNDQTVDASERMDFNGVSASSIQPFLGLQNAVDNVYLGATEADRAQNLIEYIRGKDPILDTSSFIDSDNSLNLRDRVIYGQTWKLGDIIHSTPVAVSTPVDNYGAIYGDQTYQAFYNQYKNRETTVYVGANDGMLHAFTSWRYDSTAKSYVKPAVASSSEEIGDELWAYIPQNLLPHLKWLARPDYSHVFYMDLQPKVFDARIFPEDATHPHGWGTVLIAGMNTGGGDIFATGAFDGSTSETRYFRPSYAAIDVTDPRNPRLLWEKTFAGLNHTTSFPAVLRVEDSSGTTDKGIWYATFGSGPATYEGTSSTNGRIYVVDLLTGNPYKSGTNDWLFQTAETRAFMGSPASIDMGLNYNVDAFYIGQTYDSSNNATPSWKGTLYKVRIPWEGTLPNSPYGALGTNGRYNSDPTSWRLVRLFNSPRPITAAPALSLDQFLNTWIYFGTGRYFNLGLGGDKSSTETEYLYGIKDPFFNKEHQLDQPLAIPPKDYIFNDDYYHNTLSALTLAPANLFNADPYSVLDNGTVLTGAPGTYTVWGNFDLLKRTAWTKDGWQRTLPSSTSAERSLTKPAVIGGVSLFTTFTPEGDVCSFGGNSYLYALYYETGTAYKQSVFKKVTQTTVTEIVDGVSVEVTKNVYTGATDTVTVDGETQEKVVDKTDLGSGTTSSVGIHVGSQSGGEATGYVQQGTGNVIDFGFKPAFNIRSGLRSWRIAEPNF
ncbi:pilus assembly protein PilY [Desulfuromonas soudanensis]|uniref:Pilus assembly protein PilY n=1 Tax=Desulfuromonas soudanensis TaxID=1603606 RepID=A0A0M5IZ93_9BACT|nr:PilC/PilY family type IV pilus protein [Desulfuromonas soudanensis]ALC16931.1 pilus assembly protein PilY [Desulfuromonas soudanensis]